MKPRCDEFIFRDRVSQSMQDDDFLVRIPSGITARDQLFEVLSRDLRFPSYFGENWDALRDCLCDLSWIKRRRVIIAHEAVPQLEVSILRVYLETLAECVNDWTSDEEHELLVVFPSGSRALICATIGEGKRG